MEERMSILQVKKKGVENLCSQMLELLMQASNEILEILLDRVFVG